MADARDAADRPKPDEPTPLQRIARTAASGVTRVTDTTNLGGGGPRTMTLYAHSDDLSTLAATGTSPTG